jgi:hypothetical protein
MRPHQLIAVCCCALAHVVSAWSPALQAPHNLRHRHYAVRVASSPNLMFSGIGETQIILALFSAHAAAASNAAHEHAALATLRMHTRKRRRMRSTR